ncbi:MULTISPECIES: carbohydrate ABC transporter permease [unclassified Microbacterium]|uniref:carbohydrate ABC transporter permease n=1 Tax=unclassified Microbacterium TaxID=2609290 RepID=UPI00301A66BB
MTTTLAPTPAVRYRGARTRKRLATAIIGIIAVLALAGFVTPLIYTMIGSLQPPLGDQKAAFPYFPNYAAVFQAGFGAFFGNSLIITVITVIATVLLSAMVAYPLAQAQFRGRKALDWILTLGLMIPYQVVLLPLFLIYSQLHMLDTVWTVIIPMVAFGMPFSVFLMVPFFRGLDRGVLEAAVIDGAGPTRIFWTVVLPLSRNILITVGVLRAIFAWNEYLFAYTFIRSQARQTLVLGLNNFIGSEGLINWGPMFAAITVSVLPALVVYMFLNRYLVAGLADGATKE